MTVARRVAILCAAIAVLAASACAKGAEPGSSTPPTTTPTAILDSPTTVETTAAPAPSYPSTARAYAEAILAAWTGDKTDRLGQLTTPTVQDQILEIPGPIDEHWHYSRCEGAAGSSYCIFHNNPGDMIRIRITNELLKQAHAAVEVVFDPVTFPSDPVLYVKEFIAAWQDGNTYR